MNSFIILSSSHRPSPDLVFVLYLSKEINAEINLINNYGINALVEVCVENVPSELENIKIIDAKLKEKYGITVGVIKRDNEYVQVTKDTIIQKGDTLTLVGPYKNIKMLFKTEEE